MICLHGVTEPRDICDIRRIGVFGFTTGGGDFGSDDGNQLARIWRMGLGYGAKAD